MAKEKTPRNHLWSSTSFVPGFVRSRNHPPADLDILSEEQQHRSNSYFCPARCTDWSSWVDINNIFIVCFNKTMSNASNYPACIWYLNLSNHHSTRRLSAYLITEFGFVFSPHVKENRLFSPLATNEIVLPNPLSLTITTVTINFPYSNAVTITSD